MSRPDPAPSGGSSGGPTRRRFLAGAGAVGLAAAGLGSGVADASDGPSADGETDGRALDDPAAVESAVDRVLEDRIGDDVPGATVAVVEGDDVVLAKGYGTADAAAETSVDADETAFRVGSVGKLVTWTAVMQGVEDGRLDLDEDVGTYLDDSAVEIPDAYDDPITLRHLGTHTAGFEAGLDPGLVGDPAAVTSLETTLAENRPDRVRPPGEAVAYSNYGAALAGHVVAEAYDTTFEEYVQSRILGPLGMDHSTFEQPVPDGHPGELASPHRSGDEGFEVADRLYINWGPAGSMTATATDMAAFARAHLGGGTVDGRTVLDAETVERMHDTHYERHPAVNNWRYGFYEYGPPDAGIVAHSGGTVHFSSELALVPDSDVGVFVSYNRRSESASPTDVVDAVLDEFDLLPDPRAPSPTSGPAVRERADRVAGEYRTTMVGRNGPTKALGLLERLTVEATDDGGLVTEAMGGDRRTWIETDPYVYRERDGRDVLAFDVEDGDVAAAHLSSAPQGTYRPVPVHERRLVSGGVLGAATLGFLLSLLWWAGRGAWRRVRGGEPVGPSQRFGRWRRVRSPSWLARTASVGLCVTAVGFLVGVAAVLVARGPTAVFTNPLPLRVVRLLPPLVALLAAGTVLGTAAAWRNGYWSVGTRLHRTLLAALGAGFVWQLSALGFLPV
jgi:CubicO group peptidase (beta-lactamase class C family)